MRRLELHSGLRSRTHLIRATVVLRRALRNCLKIQDLDPHVDAYCDFKQRRLNEATVRAILHFLFPMCTPLIERRDETTLRIRLLA